MKKKYLSILALSMALTTSCNFLDVMPDKLGTIEYAFRDQVSAEKYLATCYSYIPSQFATNDVYMYGNETVSYTHLDREIGRLEERIRQMTIEKEKHVSDAPISGTANVG